MNSKLIPIAYTVAVIAPNIALKAPVMKEIMALLEENDFEVFDRKDKTLKNEEILNLFYKHQNEEFFKDIDLPMKSGDSIVLLLINKTDVKIDPETREETKLEDPITRFKKLLGKLDPEEAKAEDENSLRAKYGVSLIPQGAGFWGSDNARAANKERDIFKF